MFDSLLGRKFTAKCKHAVKCVNSRAEPIRRKKQATLRFLRKDVADLLANGLDSNAFGRIDALIVEINRTACYDMIEQYCSSILNQLPCMQKQRECPEDAMEAVSTLIFAAARLSDLPELSNLRHAFLERYGNYKESFVNSEFVEKLQNKSFSTDKKLQLMREISEEFSVGWDPEAFRRKLSDPCSTASSRCKSDTSSYKGIDSHSLCADDDELDILPKRRVRPDLTENVYEEETHPETKDIHVIPSMYNNQLSSAAHIQRKVFNEPEAEIVKPCNFPEAPFCELKAPEIRSETFKEDQNFDGRSMAEEDGLLKYVASKVSYDIPPYTKAKASKIEASVEGNEEEALDYKKLTVKPIPPEPIGVEVPAGAKQEEAAKPKDGLVTIEKSRPRSVRSKTPKPRASDDIEQRMDKMGSISSMNPRAPSGLLQKPSGGGATTACDAEVDEEERVMDKLLLHYSKKGIHAKDHAVIEESRKEQGIHGDRPVKVASHHSRATSLPPEPTRGEGVVKGPARAASLQLDSARGRVHPKLPDFEELAARVMAFRME